MYRFIREKNGQDPHGTSAGPYASSNRLFVQSSEAAAALHSSFPADFNLSHVESRLQENNRSFVTISVDQRDGSSPIFQHSQDAVTRILVNETPGFQRARNYGMVVREETADESPHAISKHKLVKRRRNITEEETVTVTRRIRRLKAKSLVLDQPQVVPFQTQVLHFNRPSLSQKYFWDASRKPRNFFDIFFEVFFKKENPVFCSKVFFNLKKNLIKRKN
jgi:hypothetical protein